MSELTELIASAWADEQTDSGADPSELPYDERIEYWADSVRASQADRYHGLIRQDCAPRIAAAACRYAAGVDGDAPTLTQEAVAAKYGVSSVSVRKWYHVQISGRIDGMDNPTGQ